MGVSWDAFLVPKAFLYEPGAGMVSIHDPVLLTESEAVAINNAGVVVGKGKTPGGVWRAFRWTEGGGMKLLKINDAVAEDINDKGVIAGSKLNGGQRGVVWWGNAAIVLGTLGGSYSVAYGINDKGAVVGRSELGDFFTAHAFRVVFPWALALEDLGPPLSFYAFARKISDLGRIVGVDESVGDAMTSYKGGKFIHLPDFGWTADAFDVSRCGTIVGFAYTAGGGQSRPVRWDKKFDDCP